MNKYLNEIYLFYYLMRIIKVIQNLLENIIARQRAVF
jgi:hypothetical protein